MLSLSSVELHASHNLRSTTERPGIVPAHFRSTFMDLGTVALNGDRSTKMRLLQIALNFALSLGLLESLFIQTSFSILIGNRSTFPRNDHAAYESIRNR